MKLLLCLLCLLLGDIQAGAQPAIVQPAPLVSQDADFQKLADACVDGYLAWRPQSAASLGLHSYDGGASDLHRASIEIELERLQFAQKALRALNPAALSPANAVDARTLDAALSRELFWFLEARSFSRNPMVYAAAADLSSYLRRDYAPRADRLRAVVAVERQVPALLDAARTNLDKKLAKPCVEASIELFSNQQDDLANELPALIGDLPETRLLAEFKKVNQAAADACGDFAAWLRTEKLPNATSSYALGVEKFTRYLKDAEQVNLSPYQLFAMGKRELKKEQERFSQTAAILGPQLTPGAALALLQQEHPAAENLLPETARHLEQIRQFVADRKIASLSPLLQRPPAIETPRAQRTSLATASLDLPGPFEKDDSASYNLNPLARDWPRERIESSLAANNYYAMDLAIIQQVWPGNYLQARHLQTPPASRVQKVFEHDSFVDGWAHYCGQMLLDEGYGAGDPQKNARYRLAQSADSLLQIGRLCVAAGLHCQGMTVAEAAKFLQENCYLDPASAAQEAQRGTYDPSYLSAALGQWQLRKLRADYQKQEGPAFSLLHFHDAILSHGAPPIRALRTVLLRDPIIAAQALPTE